MTRNLPFLIFLAFTACTRVDDSSASSKNVPTGTNQPGNVAQASHVADGTGEALEFPTRGVRLIAPSGWHRIHVDQGKGVVSWMSGDSTPEHLQALIKVEAARGVAATAEATARGLATDWGGTVLSEKLSLDGEPAFRVLAANDTSALKPVEGIVAIHNGYLYMVLGGVTAGHECHRQIQELATGWKWLEVIKPSAHLVFWPQPNSVLGGRVLLNYPTDMRFYATEHPDTVLDLGLYDMRKNDTPFLAYIQLTPMPKEKGFAEAADTMLQYLKKQKLVDEALVWRRSENESARRVTGSVRSALISQNLKRDAYTKLAVLQLDEDHLVLINFTICTANAQERDRYDTAADAIVQSVQKPKDDRR
jgi:hypothetical protein